MRCPSCGKSGFLNDTAVARHMSQPRSGCSTWLDDLIRMQSTVPTETQSDTSDDEPQSFAYLHPNQAAVYNEWDDVEMGMMADDDGGSFGDGQGEEVTGTTDQEAVDHFPDCSTTFGRGYTFLSTFNADPNSVYRKTNLYFPFSGRQDWEVGSWLLRSGLSLAKIEQFLSLEMIQKLPLSFRSAKELRGRAEMLPSGPRWQSQVLSTSPHATKSPVVLYWRDPLECIAAILNSPTFHDAMEFTPRKVYTTAQKLCRVYSEWMTGDDAWNMQSKLPRGATLLGTILSSDKTNISTLTGNHIAHPLLIGLANIRMKTRLKSSSKAFVLTALLPVPKFIHKQRRMRGVLEDRLVHQCLDIILEPLKQAARIGVMLSDPLGHSRYCFTPLASYIVDTPEAALLSGVGGKTSPVTMAMYKQFGDPFRHEARTKEKTLAQLAIVRTRAAPSNIEAFFREAQKFRLNGVDKPFFRDWPLSEPSHFLTPEVLHYVHKKFGDHVSKWIIFAVGELQIDFRFSILQPVTGFRHFHAGISKLKQVTGRCLRDIQRSIIAVSADAAPPEVLAPVRAFMDFCYLIQSTRINEDDLTRISDALDEFHAKKDAILAAGLRRGKGNRPILNWHIPKLEFMQNMVPSTRNSGIPVQWTADVTEHAHITEIKDPARSTNNKDYDPQICRYLDRMDKIRRFELATGLLDSMRGLRASDVDDIRDDADEVEDEEDDIPTELMATVSSLGRSRPVTNYFAIADIVRRKPIGSVPLPLRTFVVDHVAIHTAYSPSIRNITVDDASEKFQLPDLRPALADFLRREATSAPDHVFTIGGGRRSGPHAELPFEKLQIWFKVRLQDTDIHDPSDVRPAQTVNCTAPNDQWPDGRYDTVLVNTDGSSSWPKSGLRGHTVAQVRMIVRPVSKSGTTCVWKDHFLVYVQRFDVVPNGHTSNDRDPTTRLHLLKRAKRSNGVRMGDVIPLAQLRAPINLVPRFGATADNRLTSYNSMEHSSEFWLNRYWDKNTFGPLSM